LDFISERLYWYGTDDFGRMVASGAYMYELRAEGVRGVREIIIDEVMLEN